MNALVTIVLGIILAPFVLLLGCMIGGTFVYALWNLVMSTEVTKLLFGVESLGFWHSCGISLLFASLFKSTHYCSKE